jgi:hypothetical protein
VMQPAEAGMRDDATGSDRSGSGRGGFLAEPEMRGPATCRAAYGGVRAFVAESFDAAPHLYKRGETSVQPGSYTTTTVYTLIYPFV